MCRQNRSEIMEKLNCEPAVALKEEKNFIQFSEKYLQTQIFQL